MKKKKRKVFIKRMRQHLLFLLIAFTAMMAALVGVVVKINLRDGQRYSEKVLSQKYYENKTVPYKRGDILDCNGSILATSVKVYNLVISPMDILETEGALEPTEAALGKYFGVTKEEMNKFLEDPESQYEIVRKQVTYDQMKEFTDFEKTKAGWDVVGVTFEDQFIRVYPNNELACHVLGFVVGGNVGIGGLEGSYDTELNGTDGRIYSYLGEDFTMEREVEPSRDGYSLVTTIDTEIQRIVQDKSEKYMKEVGAKNISVLVMNPKNSAVMALYNCHQYDPNDAYKLDPVKYQYDEKNFEQDLPALSDEEFQAMKKNMSDEEKLTALNTLWRNYVISDNFEPGSTYKPFTISGALEEGIVKPEDQFFCDGHQIVADWDIHCHLWTGHGMLTVSEALEQSCNDCLMQIAAMEGPTIFDKYQVQFGFGKKTNIDLPGEPSEDSMYYMLYHQDTLNVTELATSSFGQGVTVTMMQLGTAFCSLINGGYYYQPHVVKQILDADGNVIENFDKTLVRRTVSTETADQVRNMLLNVVEEGTGSKAIVEGYSIGGKTGTAEKLPRNNGKYVLSFIGFAPADDPQVMVYCVVDEPRVDNPAFSSAGTVLFNMIAEDLLPYMNIHRTETPEHSEEGIDEIASPVYNGDAPENDVAGENADEEVPEETPEGELEELPADEYEDEAYEETYEEESWEDE